MWITVSLRVTERITPILRVSNDVYAYEIFLFQFPRAVIMSIYRRGRQRRSVTEGFRECLQELTTLIELVAGAL